MKKILLENLKRPCGDEKKAVKNAEDIQNDIFRKMSVSKKLRLTSDFSAFLLELNKINSENGISRTAPRR